MSVEFKNGIWVRPGYVKPKRQPRTRVRRIGATCTRIVTELMVNRVFRRPKS